MSEISMLSKRVDGLESRVETSEKKVDIFKDKTAEKDLHIIKSPTEIDGALEGLDKFEDAVKKQLTKKGAIWYGCLSAGGSKLILEFISRVWF